MKKHLSATYSRTVRIHFCACAWCMSYSRWFCRSFSVWITCAGLWWVKSSKWRSFTSSQLTMRTSLLMSWHRKTTSAETVSGLHRSLSCWRSSPLPRLRPLLKGYTTVTMIKLVAYLKPVVPIRLYSGRMTLVMTWNQNLGFTRSDQLIRPLRVCGATISSRRV